MSGFKIGNSDIIAGHSFVSKNVPDGAAVVGMPAKQISTVEAFMEKLNHRETISTKKIPQDQKRVYFQEKHPEWFE